MPGGWENAIILVSINLIAAYGVYITLMAGALSAGHSVFLGAGGYVAGYLSVTSSGGLLKEAVVAVCVCAAIGIVVAQLVARMSPLVTALVTVAVAQIAVVVASNSERLGGPNGLSGLYLLTTFRLALLSAIVATVLVFLFERSSWGLAARATRDDPVTAASMGIRTARVRMICFVAGAVMTGMAGILYAHYVLLVVPSLLGFNQGLTILIFVLFGGSYTFVGTIFGTAILTLLPEALRFSNQDRLLLYGLLVAAVVVLRPNGIITPATTRAPASLLRRGRALGRGPVGGGPPAGSGRVRPARGRAPSRRP